MAVTVYGAAYSTYTRSALIALKEKNVSSTLSEIDIFKTIPPDYFAHQPWGKIPAFDHDGFALYETPAILRYIDETFEGPALQPSSPKLRARMMQIIGIIDSYGYGPIVAALFVQRAAMPMMGNPSDEAAITAALPKAEKALDAIVAVQEKGGFLAGNSFSLADIHLVPVIAYLCQTPEGRAMMEKRPALTAWWDKAGQQPSVVATRSPLEK